MRVEWVHPSWRDLVIEHLAEDSDARAQFLTSCGPNGILLALSSGGGARGDRELPLLVRDADWDALTDRLYHLIPELELQELTAVLDSIGDAIAALGEPANTEACALARTILEHVASLWNEGEAPVPLPGLESWLALSGRLPLFPRRPAPPELDLTWASLLPVSAPSLNDREGLERFADWLTLAELVAPHRPDYWARRGGHRKSLRIFVDSLETAGGQFDLAGRSDVVRALRRIRTLSPELGDQAAYFVRRLQARETEPSLERRREEPLRPGEAPGWRTFDVARVLEDL